MTTSAYMHGALAPDSLHEVPNPDPTGLGARPSAHGHPPRPELRLIHGDGLARAQGDAGHMVEVYRRRRFFVALAVTVAVIIGCLLAGVSLTSFGPLTDESPEPSPTVHVVRPGETYGAIAAALGVDEPVAFAAELRQANGGGEPLAGQRLVIDLDGLVSGS